MTNFKPWSLILAPYMYPRFPSVTIFKRKKNVTQIIQYYLCLSCTIS